MIWKVITQNSYLLAAISGLLCLLSFPPFNLSFLIWFALVPFLYAIVNTKFKKEKKLGITYHKVQLIGILFGIVFYYSSLLWMFIIFKLFTIMLIFVLCVYTYLFAYILNYVYHKVKNKYLILFFPTILWVAIEWFKSEGWILKFSWLNLGYSQHNVLSMLQSASVWGQYGITALIVFINSAILFMILNRKNKKLLWKTGIISSVLLIAVFIFGVISLQESYNPDVKVALIQDESSKFGVYESLINTVSNDVNFILLPEYAIIEYLDENPELLSKIKDITTEKNSYFIAGSKDRSEAEDSKRGYYNAAYIFDTKGDIMGRFYKMNPIQFFNDGDPGENFSVFDTEFGKVGILICYDGDYSYIARNIVRNGAEMLFIPTFDASGWTSMEHEQHSSMTSMRAVENRRYIARTASSGISQIIDPKGRITETIGIDVSDAKTGFIMPIKEKTFYTRFGFVLPYLCILISLIVLAMAYFKKK